MRIAIFGAGGVGGYFGGRLAQAGEEVVFIARGEHLNAILGHGLRVDSVKGDFMVHPVRAVQDTRQAGPVDVVLVAVKAWQVPEAAEAIRPLLGPETSVVPLLNGVEAPSQLAAALGEERVLGGLCRLSAAIAGPGYIRHTAIDPCIAFGELSGEPGSQPSERAQRLLQVFERCQGVKAEIPLDIQVALWMKFLFIAAISGVGAAARAPAGVIRSVPETRRLLEQAMQEVYDLARGRGIRLPEAAVAQTMAFVDGMAPGTTASMQRDILDGLPSELEAQNGAVCRLARESGIPSPAHDFLYTVLLPQEQQARQAKKD